MRRMWCEQVGVSTMIITLSQQIERAKLELADHGGKYEQAILASLKRLQAIEQQNEIVGWQFQDDDDGGWHFGSEHHKHRENTVKGGYKIRDVYALQVSPAIPEGYALQVSPAIPEGYALVETPRIPHADEWKKNVMLLWVLGRKHDSSIPDTQLDFMRNYLLAASEVK